jgi:hypothetical protein
VPQLISEEKDMMTEYSTSNLSVSAYLLTRRFEIDRLEQRGETIFFVFRDPEGTARQIVNEYYGNGVVFVRDFVAGLKVCRDRLFGYKRELQFQQGSETNDYAQKVLGR